MSTHFYMYMKVHVCVKVHFYVYCICYSIVPLNTLIPEVTLHISQCRNIIYNSTHSQAHLYIGTLLTEETNTCSYISLSPACPCTILPLPVLPSLLPCRQCTHAPRATHSVMALLSHSFCEKANLTNLDFLLKFDHYITLALH